MPDNSLSKAKEFLERLRPKKEGASPLLEEAAAGNKDFTKQIKADHQAHKDSAKSKAVAREEHVTGSLGRVELVEKHHDGSIKVHVKGVATSEKHHGGDAQRHSAAADKTAKDFTRIDALHKNKEPDLKEKSEVFEMFQKMAPGEQARVVKQLGVGHLNEIHGLERMNNYPPDNAPKAIVPGELVDLAKSTNNVDKEFASRSLDSYNCMDFALRRMDGGTQPWQDKVGMGAETIVNSRGLKALGMSEVHGPAKAGDFVAIKENFLSFLHAGVVETVSKDGTVTVIEKLGSTNQLPVIRQTLTDFSRTWNVNPADIKIFRKQ